MISTLVPLCDEEFEMSLGSGSLKRLNRIFANFREVCSSKSSSKDRYKNKYISTYDVRRLGRFHFNSIAYM